MTRLTKSLALTALLAPLAVYVSAWAAQCYKPRRGDFEGGRHLVRYVNVLGEWRSYGYSDPCHEVIAVDVDRTLSPESANGQMVVSGGSWTDDGRNHQKLDRSLAAELGVRQTPVWLYKKAVAEAQLPCIQVMIEFAGWPKPCLYSLRHAEGDTPYVALWDTEHIEHQKAPNVEAFVWPVRRWTPVYRPVWGPFVYSLGVWFVLLFFPCYLLVNATLIAARAKQWWRRRRGRCPSCRYSLVGLPPGSACPECGKS